MDEHEDIAIARRVKSLGTELPVALPPISPVVDAPAGATTSRSQGRRSPRSCWRSPWRCRCIRSSVSAAGRRPQGSSGSIPFAPRRAPVRMGSSSGAAAQLRTSVGACRGTFRRGCRTGSG